jgi:hypothetical protein
MLTISFEEVFQILDTDVFAKNQRRLKDVERFILWGAWKDQTYDEMTKDSNYRYTPSYLKQDIGPKLWKLLSKTLEEEVSKTNFRVALERRVRLQPSLDNQKQLKNLEIFEENVIKKQDSKIWRSFLHTPFVEDILIELLQYLTNEQKAETSKDIDKKIPQLIERLRVVLLQTIRQ